jgi:hypothetical protein
MGGNSITLKILAKKIRILEKKNDFITKRKRRI